MSLAMATDVSKFLKFACGDCPTPDWSRLADRDQLLAFHEKVVKSGCGAAGQLSKLESLEAGLRFLRVDVLADDRGSHVFQKAQQASESIAGWKATIRKEKGRRRVQKLEELSSSKFTLDDVERALRTPAIWDDFAQTTRNVECGREVTSSELNRATIVLAALLTFLSWQRPGAAANATLREFKHIEQHRVESGEMMSVLRVVNHKTGVSGSAKLVLTPADFSKLEAYVRVIRPQIDVSNSCLHLLCLRGRDDSAKQVSKFSTHFSNVMARYGLDKFTATTVRKLAAKKAGMCFDTTTADFVTHQLSHTATTHRKYYEALSSSAQAAEAVSQMAKVQETPRQPAAKSPHLQPPQAPTTEAMAVEPQAAKVLSQPRLPPPVALTPAAAEIEPKEGPVSRKRQKYSRDEEELIELYFADYIQSKTIAPMSECRSFVANHGIDRSAKHIQDKLKSYKRQNT